jgi:hypothetical protein
MPFLLNEDAALMHKLQGMTVFDVNNPDGLPVPVIYRLPEDELSAMTYPIVVIELTDIAFASDRQFSGEGLLSYSPEGSATWWGQDDTEFNPQNSPYRYDVVPTAYNINYRVSVYSRLVRDHLLPLTSRLLQYDMLTARGAYLEVPQDGTWRHVTLLGGPKIAYANVDVDDNQKRMMASTFLIQVPTEILNPITDLSVGLYSRATQIDIDLTCYQDLKDINLATVRESIGLISSGANLGWNTLAN